MEKIKISEKVHKAAKLNEKQIKEVIEYTDFDDVAVEDVEFERYDYYGLPVLTIGGGEFAVAKNEKEAIQAAKESIKDTLWAFNTDFIVDHIDPVVRNFDMDNLSVDLDIDDYEDEDEYYEELDRLKDEEFNTIFKNLPGDKVTSELYSNLLDGSDFFDALERVQERYAESANDLVEALIEEGSGLDKFVKDAIRADGIGHFLSGYDGEEVETDSGMLVYRIN